MATVSFFLLVHAKDFGIISLCHVSCIYQEMPLTTPHHLYYLFPSASHIIAHLDYCNRLLTYLSASALTSPNLQSVVKTRAESWTQWHTPIIPVTPEAEAGGLQVQSQPKQLSKTLSQNKKDGDVAQWLSIPGFNPQ
ncbi:hypothetical protein H1C71_034715 [Ictidomys tridecemlineatus]|nr:hypothetical protein H1C71_034715 [Ictidomys tridecemlineatus]